MESVHIAVKTMDNALAIGRSNTIANGFITANYCTLQQTMTTFQ